MFEITVKTQINDKIILIFKLLLLYTPHDHDHIIIAIAGYFP